MKANLWVVDDDQSIRWVLERALKQEDFNVDVFADGESVLEAIQEQQPQALITDIRMPGIDGIEMLEKIHADFPDMPVIIMTAHSDLDSAVSAFQSGAFEYLPKPFDVDDAVELAKRAVALSMEKDEPAQAAEVTSLNNAIIGAAPTMQEVFRAIGRLSRSNITVMINGESGTGKELVARALHDHSPRTNDPFIAINTAAIPKDLLESELFGHEKGAFTGAHSQRRGRFEQADGGTLFLDEIGDMPAELQTRLLRVLADGEFYRVGGHVPVKVDVRIIAATHQNLETLVEAGDFREDLFHRLNVIRIHIPALRDRSEDVPLLLDYYLKRSAKELNVEPKTIDPGVLDFLSQLSWPGNVRQLENTCRWLTVMASGKTVLMDDLPPELYQQRSNSKNGSTGSAAMSWEDSLAQWASNKLNNGEKALLDTALPTFERIMIEQALKQTGGRKQDAAVLLGWGRNTLTRKIQELNLDV